MGVTERLYYDDCYLREFSARVVETADEGRRVYLDRTAFYPAGGGQPSDAGTLGGVAVLDVVAEQDGDQEDRVAHLVAAPIPIGDVEGRIDWPRRFDHMQQHTGQHLLSAVLEERFQFPTLSFHMGADVSTIEIGAASLDVRQVQQAEERCAEIVRAALPIAISLEEAGADLGLRKESRRQGTLRVVSIGAAGDVDRSACGGTHVRTTAEIGPVFLRKTEKIRGNVRVEFVCGGRALRNARHDFHSLQEIARQLSVSAERAPDFVAAQSERIKALEKTAQKLAVELAQREGREQWAAAEPDAGGIRRLLERGPMDDAMRTRAQAFVAQGKAVFVAVYDNPPSLLLASSADSGMHAGERLKAAVSAAGGRGGGNQALAHGTVPAPADAARIAEELQRP